MGVSEDCTTALLALLALLVRCVCTFRKEEEGKKRRKRDGKTRNEELRKRESFEQRRRAKGELRRKKPKCRDESPEQRAWRR